jgi:RNA polymerase sigma-70 factor (ECF subfamily)
MTTNLTEQYVSDTEREAMSEQWNRDFTEIEHAPVWSSSLSATTHGIPSDPAGSKPGLKADDSARLPPIPSSRHREDTGSRPAFAAESAAASSSSETHHDDDWLVSSALQGDEDAFNVLFSRYRSLLYRLAYRVLRNREESEDAVQNCLLLAFCKLEGFKHAGAFRSWLARILFNEAVSILRKRRNHVTQSSERLSPEEHSEILDALPAAGPDPERALARKQSALALVKKVYQLCPLQRSALLLCGVKEYTTEEASAVLKVPANTVRTRLFRARKQLAAAMRIGESTDGVADAC